VIGGGDGVRGDIDIDGDKVETRKCHEKIAKSLLPKIPSPESRATSPSSSEGKGASRLLRTPLSLSDTL
jgi:hypothetical protein